MRWLPWQRTYVYVYLLGCLMTCSYRCGDQAEGHHSRAGFHGTNTYLCPHQVGCRLHFRWQPVWAVWAQLSPSFWGYVDACVLNRVKQRGIYIFRVAVVCSAICAIVLDSVGWTLNSVLDPVY